MAQLIKNYFHDDKKRAALNALTRSVFGFDFADWVRHGYDTGDYFPYSWEEDGRILSNASVNRMVFALTLPGGTTVERTYGQIGTVMTAPAFRRQGLAGSLIRTILQDTGASYDGFYLFANLHAVDFYRSLGFQPCRETRASLRRAELGAMGPADFVPIRHDSEKQKVYMSLVRHGIDNSAFFQRNRFGLQMFYTGNFETVYVSPSLSCFACYERDGDTLLLHSALSKKPVSVLQVLRQIPEPFETAILGFTPRADERPAFTFTPFDGGDDYRLFTLGASPGTSLTEIEEQALLFPTYSHA